MYTWQRNANTSRFFCLLLSKSYPTHLYYLKWADRSILGHYFSQASEKKQFKTKILTEQEPTCPDWPTHKDTDKTEPREAKNTTQQSKSLHLYQLELVEIFG